MDKLNLSLTEGRHAIPQATNGSIFGQEISAKLLVNPALLEEVSFSKIWGICYRNGLTHLVDDEGDCGNTVVNRGIHINLYVTGLTVALIAVLNVCHNEGITVTLYHYDRESNSYYPQEVV